MEIGQSKAPLDSQLGSHLSPESCEPVAVQVSNGDAGRETPCPLPCDEEGNYCLPCLFSFLSYSDAIHLLVGWLVVVLSS